MQIYTRNNLTTRAHTFVVLQSWYMVTSSRAFPQSFGYHTPSEVAPPLSCRLPFTASITQNSPETVSHWMAVTLKACNPLATVITLPGEYMTMRCAYTIMGWLHNYSIWQTTQDREHQLTSLHFVTTLPTPPICQLVTQWASQIFEVEKKVFHS